MKTKIQILLMVLFMIFAFLSVGYYESHYTRIAKYVGNNEFVDTCGYKWVYDGDFEENQQYELKMFNNNTDTITDDIILEVK